jgi:hypothetical protein
VCNEHYAHSVFVALRRTRRGPNNRHSLCTCTVQRHRDHRGNMNTINGNDGISTFVFYADSPDLRCQETAVTDLAVNHPNDLWLWLPLVQRNIFRCSPICLFIYILTYFFFFFARPVFFSEQLKVDRRTCRTLYYKPFFSFFSGK